jgi:predicted Fe-Mo cluster-binding NifX family protein
MKKIVLSSFVILLLISVAAYASQENSVKLAVASDGKTHTASVSSQAARCSYYLIFDGTAKLIEVIDNPFRNASGGAGPSVAGFLAQKGIAIVVAESFGNKMTNAIKDKGIKYYKLKGSAEDAVKKILKIK